MWLSLGGWVAGVALQLQQAGLWPMAFYLATVLAGLLGVGGALWLARSGHHAPVQPGWRAALAALCLIAGLALGFGATGARSVAFAADALNPELQGLNLELTGRVASMPRRGLQGERFDFAIESAQQAGEAVQLPPLVQLSWFAEGQRSPGAVSSPGLRAGERWRFTVRLRTPHGNANPHGFDRERWLWEHGIQATGYVRSGPRDPVPVRLGTSGRHLLEAARQDVVQAIERRVPDPRSAGVLAALVAGDQAAIERDDWSLFRTTGVAHLMSISGLHVTMFAWLAMALLRVVWRRLARWLPRLLLAVPAPVAASVGGLLLAGAYALFSGWGVPSQRTLLMLAVVMGLRLDARQWPWPAVWLLAMAVVLLLDPWALMQPGFWLSFVAVAILFATDPGRRADRGQLDTPTSHPVLPMRAARALVGLVREQSVVTLALAPLTLLLFGQFSLVGLLANVLAIPWVTLVVTPLAMLGTLVPLAWDLAALAVQGLTQWLQWLAIWPMASIYRAVAPLPLAILAVLGGVLLVLHLPWSLRLGGLLLVWPALFWAPPRPASGEFELLALDVGQGSAVLVRTAQHTLLYDTGPRYASGSNAGEQIVMPLLRAVGERPDTVVVSHRDSDHAGGAASVREAYPEARWLSSFDESPSQRCQAGQKWAWDGVIFEVLHPGPNDYAPVDGKARSSNAMSCVLRIHNPRQSVWLAGDLPQDQEVQLAMARPELRADVMLAPHHGSLTSSSPVLLNTLRPRWVLIQSGYLNQFRHPAAAVLERYGERGVTWVNSPFCGAALWQSARPDVVHCYRDEQRRYWHHVAAPQSLIDVETGPFGSNSTGID